MKQSPGHQLSWGTETNFQDMWLCITSDSSPSHRVKERKQHYGQMSSSPSWERGLSMSFLQAFGGGGFYSHYLPAIKKVGRSGTQPEKVECLRPVECLSDFHLLQWMILVYMNIACLLISLVVLHTASFFFQCALKDSSGVFRVYQWRVVLSVWPHWTMCMYPYVDNILRAHDLV